MKYCLDSWAVLAWLEGTEPAATRVDEVLATERPAMSWINVGEVFYQIHRRMSVADAREVVRRIRPWLMLDLPSEVRVLEAAGIKATHAIAYADAFAVATAVAHQVTLLTGDPEIVTASAAWPIEDLR